MTEQQKAAPAPALLAAAPRANVAAPVQAKAVALVAKAPIPAPQAIQ